MDADIILFHFIFIIPFCTCLFNNFTVGSSNLFAIVKCYMSATARKMGIIKTQKSKPTTPTEIYHQAICF